MLIWSKSGAFRFAVYGSVLLTVTTLTLWQGTNLYIEHIHLGKSLPYTDDAYGWDEDDTEAWSGGRLGGGTDPRLPFLARLAIRSAFTSQLHPAGPVSALSSSKAATPGGGSFISGGQDLDAMQVPDAGYVQAEAYLAQALTEAASCGLTLPDRAVIELEERLAGVRERIGGRTCLIQAKIGYQRIFDALIATSKDAKPEQDWNKREALRLSRKLGELSLRLATETSQPGSTRQKAEKEEAEKRLLWSAATSLGVGLPVRIDPEPVPASAPARSFLGFGGRRPTVKTPSPSSDLSLIAEQATHVDRLPPTVARNFVATLASLTALYASDRNLTQALDVSELALSLPFLAAHRSSTASTPRTLHQAWMDSRFSVMATYVAELKRAAKKDESECLLFLDAAIQRSDSATSSLDATGLVSPRSAWKAVMTALTGSPVAKEAERLAKKVQAVEKESRTASGAASFLAGLMHELAGRRYANKDMPDWCGGDKEASVRYLQALAYAAKKDSVVDLEEEVPRGAHVDQVGYQKAWHALKRVRERVYEDKRVL